MTTSDRLLAVLGLFTIEQPEWTVEAGARQLDLSVSTAYRYFRSLSRAGLIIPFHQGRYVLGPAITQYDRQMRLLDPLIKGAMRTMKRLAKRGPAHTVILLCRLYRNQVMCVHQESIERPDLAVSYERGRPMPLFRGAASKIILAHLGSRALKVFHAQHGAEMARYGLGVTWREVKQRLRELRSAGVAITEGELDPGVNGIAAPVVSSDGDVLGSISMAMPANARARKHSTRIIKLLREAADEVRMALSELATAHVGASARAKSASRGTLVTSAGRRQPKRARRRLSGVRNKRK